MNKMAVGIQRKNLAANFRVVLLFTSILKQRTETGCEASIHALNEIYEEEATEAILMVDASNAFNRLNR